MKIRKVLKKGIPKEILYIKGSLIRLLALLRFLKGKNIRECNLCGYQGYFIWVGLPPRHDGACKNCLSRERHRLEYLWLTRHGVDKIPQPVLHFAPEEILETTLRPQFSDYRTADLFQPADLRLDIEKIELDMATQGSIIANHVLEHVDDQKALRELYRVLKSGGLLMLTVPVIEGWKNTYENPLADTPELKDLHYGHSGHLRLYGSDFIARVQSIGFQLFDEFIAEGADVIRYSLTKGEKLFVFKK
jgi:hypothetical protein